MFGSAGLVALVCSSAAAHPLPDSKLVFSTDDGMLRIEIEVPAVELRHAMPKLDAADVISIAEQHEQIAAYFRSHLKLVFVKGDSAALEVAAITLAEATDDHAGQYTAIKVDVIAELSSRQFTLQYDAILHQVPNHAALVFWKTSDGAVKHVGQVRYDVFKKSVETMTVSAE